MKKKFQQKLAAAIAIATIALNPLTAYASNPNETSSILSSSFVSGVSGAEVSRSAYQATISFKSPCSGTASLELQIPNSNASDGWETIDTTSLSFTNKKTITLSKNISLPSGSYGLYIYISSGNQSYSNRITTFYI